MEDVPGTCGLLTQHQVCRDGMVEMSDHILDNGHFCLYSADALI